MESIISFTIFLVILILAGVLLSLPILIPQIRKAGQHNRKVRVTLLVIFGVISFLVTYTTFTWLGSEIQFIFGSMTTQGIPLEFRDNKNAIVAEIWLRQIVPPPFRQLCFTTDPRVCQMTDVVLWSHAKDQGWSDYLPSVALCMLPALTTSALVWRFTQPKENL